MTQRSAVLPAFGAPSLNILENANFDPMGPSGPDRVIVRIEAACVQATDLLVRSGSFPSLGHKPPLVMGYVFAGVVESAGAASGFSKGDKVCGMPRVGGYARFVEQPAGTLLRLADDDDAVHANAALSIITAYALLHRSPAAKAVANKEPVFVQGGTGLVGAKIVKFALEAGCPVFTSVRGSRKAEVEALGAVAYDFTQPQWWKAARRDMKQKLKGKGGGAAVVFDGIGDKGFGPSFALLRSGGLLQAYGMHKDMLGRSKLSMGAIGSVAKHVLGNILSKSFKFFTIDSVLEKHRGWFEEDLAMLLRRLGTGDVQMPNVETLRFEDIDSVHERLAKGGVTSLFILDPWKL